MPDSDAKVQELDRLRQLVEAGSLADTLEAVERILRFSPDVNSWLGGPQLDSDLMNGLQGLCERLLSMLPRNEAGLLSRVHGVLGYITLRLGSVHKAEAHLRAAIHILTWDSADLAGSIRQQRRLSIVLKNLGRFQQARFECESAINLADAHGLKRESYSNRHNLVIVHLKMGRFAEAAKLLAELEPMLEEVPDKRFECRLALVRGNYSRIHGHIGPALDFQVAALAFARQHGLIREEAIALEYMGDCYLAQRKLRRARESYDAALAIAERVAPAGDIVPELCHRIGEVMIGMGDGNSAVLICERGLQSARNAGDRYEECATHRVYAMAHAYVGNSRKAMRIADEGIALGREYGIPYELARMLAWVGERRARSTDPDDQTLGRQHLWEARGLFEHMGLHGLVAGLDVLLGFDSQPELEDEAGPSAKELGDIDPGSLRFGIITGNTQLSEAIRTLQSVAPSPIPVLITGESGVGKELLAHALHEMSPRRKAPFVAVNCGAISSSLIDSEFFGHERGAFTGALSSREGLLASADKGTLFLDEVGNLPLQMQAALLRVLETGEVRAVGRDDVRNVDIRIVAATNASLEDLLARGSFRADLFFRLNGIRIAVPPLRERYEDIGLLFRFFWSQACRGARKRLNVDDGVEGFLSSYGWPGNVRELRHEVMRAVALASDGSTVNADAFLSHLKHREVGAMLRDRDRQEETLGERQRILIALRANRGNKAEAARSLGGMKRTTLIYKIERFGIRPEEYQVKD